jgi:hypothetical protein
LITLNGMGGTNERELVTWSILLQVAGASVLLIGVVGAVRMLWSGEPVAAGVLAGHIAVMLAGGIVVGGGWGCGLGLGLVGAASLVTFQRRADQ